MRRKALTAFCCAVVAALGLSKAPAALAAGPSFGPNVIVFTPSMSQADIQSRLDQISAQQVPNSSQFDTNRYAIFFEPGTYGSTTDPLVFQVGYYEQVAGLGAAPSDTVINGEAQVLNQCNPDGTNCSGLENFWRSLSNLTINVTVPAQTPAWSPPSNDTYGAGCDASTEFWAASQAAPIRRVIINGKIFLQDYCTNTNIEGFVSGGFMADDQLNGSVCNCGQQQYFTRNSTIGTWSNGVWNQVFMGDVNAPPTNFTPGTQYTNVPASRVSEEEPFLTTDSGGNWSVFVPAVRQNSVGPSYATGPEAGTSIPISKFFIANPSTSVLAIDVALALGKNLILTPGVYKLGAPIVVTRPDTVVLGLGFATLIPQHGLMALQTLDVPGVKISGLIFDAGPVNAPVLLQVGLSHLLPGTKNANDPTLLSDVFFRIGGAEAGKATNSLVVNANNTIIDDVWAWRADHGAGVGWTLNTADTGLIVNGDNVSAYGLFVEHYQKDEVIWNGQNGEDVFFQNEMPYDVPSQARWMSSPTQLGYPAFHVSQNVTSFQGYGMGSYSFFTNPVYSSMAFQSPTTTGDEWTDLSTVFLSTAGQGGINSVIDGVGAPSNSSDPDAPQDVQSYP